jgi:hypothetical protein
MDSYIVRVYRRIQNDKGDVAGLVETVGTDEKKAFQTFSGLITAIRHAIGNDADPAVFHPKTGGYQVSDADAKKRAG